MEHDFNEYLNVPTKNNVVVNLGKLKLCLSLFLTFLVQSLGILI